MSGVVFVYTDSPLLRQLIEFRIVARTVGTTDMLLSTYTLKYFSVKRPVFLVTFFDSQLWKATVRIALHGLSAQVVTKQYSGLSGILYTVLISFSILFSFSLSF